MSVIRFFYNSMDHKTRASAHCFDETGNGVLGHLKGRGISTYQNLSKKEYLLLQKA